MRQVCFFLTVAPGKVIFNKAMSTLTSITISWTAPSTDNGVIVKYQVQSNNSGSPTKENVTDVMYVLDNLGPSTMVEFSVSAINMCGLVGEPSDITESTKPVRK